MTTPSISVVLPTAGRHQLRRSLLSVWPQLGPEDELLVVADGVLPFVRDVVSEFHGPQLTFLEHSDPESSFGLFRFQV